MSSSTNTSASAAATQSYKSTTVSINVQQEDSEIQLEPSSSFLPQNNQFTSLIETEKLLHGSSASNEKADVVTATTTTTTTGGTSTAGSTIILLTNNDATIESNDDDDDEEITAACDQEINRITIKNEEDLLVKDSKTATVIVSSSSPCCSSPEPSGNLELVGLRMMRGEEDVDDDVHVDTHPVVEGEQDDDGGVVEFEEFDLECTRNSSNHTNNKRDNLVTFGGYNVSSKTVKSSMKTIQKTSMQSSSSIEKVEQVSSSIQQQSSIDVVSNSTAAEVQQQLLQQNHNSITTMEQEQSAEIKENGTNKKKITEKKSKTGGNKKSKSNAEISKENISVTLRHHETNNFNHNNKSSTQQPTSTPSTDLEFVKKLGPGESRVFAKVCVANLRRSFGDLTVITATTNNNNTQHHASASSIMNNHSNYGTKYSSNSLEYNRINRDMKTRQLLHNTNGPSSLPSFLNNNNRNSFSNTNISKLQLFQPAYWEGLLCSSSDNISDIHKKSSFSKFDSLAKSHSKNNVDFKNKELQQDEQDGTEATTTTNNKKAGAAEPKKMYCASCDKQVFQMELIRAEKLDWHKNCFRCVTCRKVLSVDTYQSHEQKLYCKPHFKELFQPKAVIEDNESVGKDHEVSAADKRKSKLQLIICESQPKELPPDVVRASDSASTGLEDIQIDVRSKFEMFENYKEKEAGGKSPEPLPVKRSASVLAKLKKYENSVGNGGLELNGVSDEDLNGVDGIELQSDEDLDIDDEGGNSVIKDEIKRKLKNPLQAMNEIAHFKQMEQVRSKWEEGTFTKDQISSNQKKEELQKFRSRLCQGKSNQLKELYEKGVETEGVSSKARTEIEELKVEKARAFREMFEKGEVPKRGDDEDEEGSDEGDSANNHRGNLDLEVFEAGVAKESKRLFEEMDKKIASEQLMEKKQPVQRGSSRFVDNKKAMISANIEQQQQEIVKSTDKKAEDVRANTEELSSKFKFFETYEDELAKKAKENKRDQFKRITPPREDGVVKTYKDYEEEDSNESLTYRDPTIVRHGEPVQSEEDPLQHSKTTSKMLSVFRQMEENLSKQGDTPIIRPLKQFTPPRDTIIKDSDGRSSEEDEEEDPEEEDEDEEEEEDEQEAEKRMSEDDFLKEVGSLARARSLRAKFERWEQQENERNKGVGLPDELSADSIESAKNLKAKFEAMRLMGDGGQANKENHNSVPIRVNRFVLNDSNAQDSTNNSTSSSTRSSIGSNSPQQLYNNFSSLPPNLSSANHHPQIIMSSNEQCALCEKRVYVMEKVEAGGKMYHKNCFRCSQCKCILRMDTFTSNKGTLFCTTHFKQLFKIKGNYDEGFGHETQYQVWAKKQAATAQQN